MANVSTLQQRQQEIHRPFQPFTSTEGRAGRAIAEPQETYAGGWNVVSDIVGHAPKIISNIIPKNDELNPIAANAWAQANFDYNKHLSELTPEETERLDVLAQQVHQTRPEYLKNLYIQRTTQYLTDLGISPYEQMYAQEKAWKLEATGDAAKVEQREYEINKAKAEAMDKEGLAVRNPDGTVDVRRTVLFANELERSQDILVNGADSLMNRRGITREMYVHAEKNDPQTKRAYDWMIENDAKKEGIAPQLSVAINSLGNRIAAGEDPTQMVLYLDTEFATAERFINEGYWPSKDIQDNLIAYVKTYKDQVSNWLKDRSLSKEYLTDKLAELQLGLRMAALQDPGDVGVIARTSVALEDPGTNLLMSVINFDKSKLATGAEVETFGKNSLQLVRNMSNSKVKHISNVYNNVLEINQGVPPTSGTPESRSEAWAFADNRAREAIRVGWDKMPDEEKAEIQNYLSVTDQRAQDVLANRKDTQGKQGEYLANFLEKLNKPEYVTALMLPDNTELRNSYVNNADPVIQKVLRMPSGPAGTFRTTSTTAPYRRVLFDVESNKFYSPTGSFLEGVGRRTTNLFKSGESIFETTDRTWNKALEQVNDCYNAAVTAEALNRGRPLNEEERVKVAEYIKNLLKVSGVNPEVFEEYREAN